MARILDALSVTLNRKGTGWALIEPLEYRVGSKDSPEVVEVESGFPTDFASVPGPARALMSTWKKTARAAVVHDYLYSQAGREKYGYSKRQADLVFLEILAVVGHRLRLGAWAAVRAFGRPHWRREGEGGVAESRVTRLTVSQYVWVFSLGLLLTLVGAALLYEFTVTTGSLGSGSVTSRLAVGLELVPALGGGLILLAAAQCSSWPGSVKRRQPTGDRATPRNVGTFALLRRRYTLGRAESTSS